MYAHMYATYELASTMLLEVMYTDANADDNVQI